MPQASYILKEPNSKNETLIYFLYRWYRSEKPDVVHHFTIKPVIYGSIAARLAGVPRIVNTTEPGVKLVLKAKNGLPSRLHDQPAGAVQVALTSCTGGLMVAETFGAVFGPLLVIVMVYVTTAPLIGEAGLMVCVTAKSATALTVALALAELFDGTESTSMLLAEAVFVAVTDGGGLPAVGMVGVIITRTRAKLFGLIVPRLQVIGPVPVQVPLEGVAETNVNCPFGIVTLSVKITPDAAVFGPVPEVALTDRFTRPFRFETLKGRVTVVNFFFTTCPGPCIPLTRNVRLLVSTFRAEPNVGFASVSVDPAADTPDQLTTFARAQGGEFPRWDWLTGTREEIVKTCRGFFAPFGEKNKEGEILHSTKLFVVDQEGRLRSAIDTQNDGEWLERAVHDIRLLLESPALPPDAMPSPANGH